MGMEPTPQKIWLEGGERKKERRRKKRKILFCHSRREFLLLGTDVFRGKRLSWRKKRKKLEERNGNSIFRRTIIVEAHVIFLLWEVNYPDGLLFWSFSQNYVKSLKCSCWYVFKRAVSNVIRQNAWWNRNHEKPFLRLDLWDSRVMLSKRKWRKNKKSNWNR